MSTDFFDDDLLKSGGRRKETAGETVAIKAISEEGLAKMSRQKEQVDVHVVDAVKEIEQLRLRQEQLEKEKKELHELSRMHDEYQANKREIMEKLSQSIVFFEKEEMQAARMTEILSVMRAKFKDTLSELKNLKEEAWLDDNYAMELNTATVVVEDARSVYRKGLAKIEAAGMSNNLSHLAAPSIGGMSGGDVAQRVSFIYWLKVGLAVSLPLIVFLVLLFAAWLVMMGR